MKKINKSTKNNLITYGIVVIAYVIVMLLNVTGHISSLMEGLLYSKTVWATSGSRSQDYGDHNQ